MAIRKINIVEDNTAPPIILTLKRDGVAIDLTGAAVSVIIAKGSTITNTGHQAATVTTPAAGIISYTPQAGDFSTPGSYKADVQITYADTTVERLYDQLKIKARRKIS